MTTRFCLEIFLLIVALGYALKATSVGRANLPLINLLLAVSCGILLFVYAVN